MSSDNGHVFAIRESNVPLPWGYIAAKCWGEPSSPPVLVIHGIQDNAGSFDRIIPLLPGHFHYVCIDLPGHGKSSRTPPGFEIDFMQCVSVVRRVVKHFCWEKFYILAHSLGGQLGIYYAAMYPEDVIKIIVLDTVPILCVPPDEYLNHYRNLTESLLKLEEKMLKSSPPNYTYDEAINKMIAQRSFPLTKPAAIALAERGLKKGGKGYYFSADQRLKFGVLHPMMSEQAVVNIEKLKCPALFIMTKLTDASYFNDELSYKMKPVLEALKKMKNVTYVIVDGYHDVHNNEPHVVAPYINKFLNDHRSHL